MVYSREMWYIDSGLITTQHTTYYCYVTYDLCALYNVDLDLQNMLNHPDGVKAPKEILLLSFRFSADGRGQVHDQNKTITTRYLCGLVLVPGGIDGHVGHEQTQTAAEPLRTREATV